MRTRALAVLGLVALSAHAGGLYKWTDANGRVHYGDAPPAGVTAHPVGGAISVVPAPEAPETAPQPPVAPAAPTAPAAPAPPAASPANERAEKRQRMIERCERDRGVDCADQVDRLLDGPAPGSAPDWSYPVWVVPPVHRPPYPPRPPRPPKPKPPKEEEKTLAPLPGLVRPTTK